MINVSVLALTHLLDENEAERNHDWHGYVGEAVNRLHAALASLDADGTPTDTTDPHGMDFAP